ncbi:MAG: MFS transporter [Phenylobacterium sp.]|nr:MFS transporter [Phenylobacterium sp.]
MASATTHAKLPGRWGVLWLLVAVRVAMGFQFQSAASAAPWLIDAFHINYATVGSLVGLYTLPGILIALPGGYIARRVGEMNLLLFGMVLMTGGGIVSGLAADFNWVFAGRAISACGVVFLFVVMTKAVGDWFQGGERFAAMALFLNGWPVGMGLGLAAQPAIATAFGWQWIFFASATLTALALAGTLALFRHPPGYHEDAAARAPTGLSFRAIVLVILSGAAWSVINAGHISIVAFAPSFFVAQGMGTIEAGAQASFNMWAMVTGVMIGGWFTARYSRPVMWTCLTSLVGAGAALMLALGGQPTFWIIVCGLFILMGAGVQAALPLEALGTGNRALGLGLFYACWYAGFALLPWVAGWTRDLTADPAAPIIFGAGLIALTAPLLILFRFLQGRWRIAGA